MIYYNFSSLNEHYYPFEKLILKFYDENTIPKKYKKHYRTIKIMFKKKWKLYSIFEKKPLGKRRTFVYYSVYYKDRDSVKFVNAYHLIPAFRHICKKLHKETLEESDIVQIKKRFISCYGLTKKEYESIVKAMSKKRGFKTRICS